MGQAFITEDGEAIEGEALEDVIVIGRVTYFVNRAGENEQRDRVKSPEYNFVLLC